ncbi:MAG: hypothetical protein WCH44_17910, partial [Betaproteobacteria bacterium]
DDDGEDDEDDGEDGDGYQSCTSVEPPGNRYTVRVEAQEATDTAPATDEATFVVVESGHKLWADGKLRDFFCLFIALACAARTASERTPAPPADAASLLHSLTFDWIEELLEKVRKDDLAEISADGSLTWLRSLAAVGVDPVPFDNTYDSIYELPDEDERERIVSRIERFLRENRLRGNFGDKAIMAAAQALIRNVVVVQGDTRTVTMIATFTPVTHMAIEAAKLYPPVYIYRIHSARAALTDPQHFQPMYPAERYPDTACQASASPIYVRDSSSTRALESSPIDAPDSSPTRVLDPQGDDLLLGAATVAGNLGEGGALPPTAGNRGNPDAEPADPVDPPTTATEAPAEEPATLPVEAPAAPAAAPETSNLPMESLPAPALPELLARGNAAAPATPPAVPCLTRAASAAAPQPAPLTEGPPMGPLPAPAAPVAPLPAPVAAPGPPDRTPTEGTMPGDAPDDAGTLDGGDDTAAPPPGVAPGGAAGGAGASTAGDHRTPDDDDRGLLHGGGVRRSEHGGRGDAADGGHDAGVGRGGGGGVPAVPQRLTRAVSLAPAKAHLAARPVAARPVRFASLTSRTRAAERAAERS